MVEIIPLGYFPEKFNTNTVIFRTDLKKFYVNKGSYSVTSFTEIVEFVSDITMFGTGADGDITISVNTDLGAVNNKNYNNLTINAGIILQGNSPLLIKVKGTLTFESSTSKIHTNGKGGAGGLSGRNSARSGGPGGGHLAVYAKTILGVGLITSNGNAGDNETGQSPTPVDGNVGTGGKMAGVINTASAGIAGSVGGGTAGRGGGGAMAGNGGTPSGIAHTTLPLSALEPEYTGGGGGGMAALISQGECGNGGGAGGFVRIYSANSIPAIVIEAIGGKGGDGHLSLGAGGGGGGGGGRIWVFSASIDSSTKTVTGGIGGTAEINGIAGSIGSSYSVIG